MFDGSLIDITQAQRGMKIQLEFCERYRITLAEMKGTSRKRRFAEPRQLAMVEVRKQLKYSYPQIGRLFNKDHTTVLFACRKAGIEADERASRLAREAASRRYGNAQLDVAA